MIILRKFIISPYEPHREKTCLRGFRAGSTQNRAVQSQMIVRGLEFRIYKAEGFYYLCSEKNEADQAADQRLYFRIWEKQVFT